MCQTLVFEMAMTCEMCANAVRKNLAELADAVTIESIDVASNRIVVRTRKTADEVRVQLEKIGKPITFVEEG